MSMKALDELRDKLCEELDEVARKPEMGAGDLELAHKLTDTIKNIDKICMLEDCDDGYSGMWEAEGRMHGGYEDGDSYARRGMHYVRGHYSRDDGPMGDGYSQARRRDSRGRYSRDSSTENTIRHLENMLSNAGSDREREAIKQCINELKG